VISELGADDYMADCKYSFNITALCASLDSYDAHYGALIIYADSWLKGEIVTIYECDERGWKKMIPPVGLCMHMHIVGSSEEQVLAAVFPHLPKANYFIASINGNLWDRYLDLMPGVCNHVRFE
jgi:hypothetical protein